MRPVPRGVRLQPRIQPQDGRAYQDVDPRTNYFPWVNVLDLNKKYEALDFKDFRHTVTGALLTKLQHPETETFWGSKHERAGLTCADCHMPKVKEKSGKAYTWHGQRSPRLMLKDTCLRCHSYWTPEEADYEIDAIQDYIRGKITKAEFWLSQLIDTYDGPGTRVSGRSAQGGARLPRQGPYALGVVDRRELRRVP